MISRNIFSILLFFVSFGVLYSCQCSTTILNEILPEKILDAGEGKTSQKESIIELQTKEHLRVDKIREVDTNTDSSERKNIEVLNFYKQKHCTTTNRLNQKWCSSIQNIVQLKEGYLLVVAWKHNSRVVKVELLSIDKKGSILWKSEKFKNQIPSFVYNITIQKNNTYFWSLEYYIQASHRRYSLVIRKRSLSNGQYLSNFYYWTELKSLLGTFYTFRPLFHRQSKSLIITNGKEIFSVFESTPKIQWKITFSDNIVCSPTANRSGEIFFCLKNGNVVSLSKTGKVLWKTSLPKRSQGNMTIQVIPIVGNRLAYSKYILSQESGKILYTMLSKSDTNSFFLPNGNYWAVDSGFFTLYSSSHIQIFKSKLSLSGYNSFWLLENNDLLVLQGNSLFLLSSDRKIESFFQLKESLVIRNLLPFLPKVDSFAVFRDKAFIFASLDRGKNLISVTAIKSQQMKLSKQVFQYPLGNSLNHLQEGE
jgi:hypothetical protein